MAPCKIFANIHHLKVKITGSKKTTAVPIVMDNAEDPSAIMTRTNDFNLTNIKEMVRMPVVGSAFRELAGKLENPYTVIGKDITEQKRERLSDLLDIHPRPTEGQSDEAVSSTNIIGVPVEENRSTLSHVASVFLPD